MRWKNKLNRYELQNSNHTNDYALINMTTDVKQTILYEEYFFISALVVLKTFLLLLLLVTEYFYSALLLLLQPAGSTNRHLSTTLSFMSDQCLTLSCPKDHWAKPLSQPDLGQSNCTVSTCCGLTCTTLHHYVKPDMLLDSQWLRTPDLQHVTTLLFQSFRSLNWRGFQKHFRLTIFSL